MRLLFLTHLKNAVALEVSKGEVLSFISLMSAGRTEVARIIFGADPRDAGEILVDSQSVNVRAPHAPVGRSQILWPCGQQAQGRAIIVISSKLPEVMRLSHCASQ